VKYEEYIKTKQSINRVDGIEVKEVSPVLFNFQSDLTKWALRKGRAAIFADTGLGKTLMQSEWAKHVSKKGRVLMLAPLAVAEQTVQEAKEKLGIEITYCRKDEGKQITITNYEMMEHFNAKDFIGVVLDESSILKSYSGRTRTALIDMFQKTPYRLACTATPSPNDYTELGNHSEFLGVKTRSEMLAEYFVHDLQNTQDWRLKGHAVKPFWRWVSSWGAMLKRPSDLGYPDEGFKLPPLNIIQKIIAVNPRDFWGEGFLFPPDVKTLSDQRTTRRATSSERVKIAAEIANMKGPCLVWCELNDEADAVEKEIKDSVQVKGSDSIDKKKENLVAFTNGEVRVMVSKVSICGFGMNWQKCNRMVFLGASHSYEQTYQAIRRCWRFGQKKPVDVYVISADTESSIMENFRRKEEDAEKMAEEMVSMVKESLVSEIRGSSKEWNDYSPSKEIKIPEWIGVDA